MNQKTKRNLTLAIVLLILSGGGIGYYLFNKGPLNVQGSEALKINAGELYEIFSKNAAVRNAYTGKVLIISGKVYDLSVNQQQKKIVLLKTNTDGAYINCTMEENMGEIHAADQVQIKGICSGMGEGDAELGIKADLYLTRCYLGK